jgi:hypothetical protein
MALQLFYWAFAANFNLYTIGRGGAVLRKAATYTQDNNNRINAP